MTETTNSKPYDLADRTFLFTRQVVALTKMLPRTIANIEFVKQLITADAKFRLERSFRIIHAGVDNFTVPGTCFLAKGIIFFQNDNLAVFRCQGFGNSQANNSSANDSDFD